MTMQPGPDPQFTAELLVPLLYDDLRRIAHRLRWKMSGAATLQTTALVHEAYLKLSRSPQFNDRQHFLRAAAIAMRHILMNLARDALSDRRGAGAVHVPLDEGLEMPAESAEFLLHVTDALERLAVLSPRLAQIVECRFFAGYSDQETATALDLSERTVQRDWLKARAWLLSALEAS